MLFEFTVTVEVERSEGKFAGRDELMEQILDALESANPNTLEGDNGGQYDVNTWDVVYQEPAPKVSKKRKNNARTDVRAPGLWEEGSGVHGGPPSGGPGPESGGKTLPDD
jgi:hypothetical protein